MNSTTGTRKFSMSSSGSSEDSVKKMARKKKTKVPKVNPHHFDPLAFAYDYEAELLQSEEYQLDFLCGDNCADMMLLQEFQRPETYKALHAGVKKIKANKKEDDDNGWVFVEEVGSKKKK